MYALATSFANCRRLKSSTESRKSSKRGRANGRSPSTTPASHAWSFAPYLSPLLLSAASCNSGGNDDTCVVVGSNERVVDHAHHNTPYPAGALRGWWLFFVGQICTVYAGTGKWLHFFPQRPESEFARFTAQEAFFEAERPFHAVPGWSKYLAEPSEHPQPSRTNPTPPGRLPTAAQKSHQG